MWREYVPVATRLARAKRQVSQLKKKGKRIKPIEIQGRMIAKKFWGKQWCDYIETFSDYDNRLPRGRSYVRNGSVCHLEIKKGSIDALVAGSSLYHVEVKIEMLNRDKWQIIKDRCCGQISSLIELLKGNISDRVMEVVIDRDHGLLPIEEEIEYSCDCLDWADMCKHVAAVLYGVGSRLDQEPELLFKLRGVDPKELIQPDGIVFSKATDNALADSAISDIFGIDLDDKIVTNSKKNEQEAPNESQSITGDQLRNFRLTMGLSVRGFAKMLGVTPGSIYRWEKEKVALRLHARSAAAVTAALKRRHDKVISKVS